MLNPYNILNFDLRLEVLDRAQRMKSEGNVLIEDENYDEMDSRVKPKFNLMTTNLRICDRGNNIH